MTCSLHNDYRSTATCLPGPMARGRRIRTACFVLALGGLTWAPRLAMADDASAGPDIVPQIWAVHGQATFVDQAALAFHSPYKGPNSLDPGTQGRETFDATLYAGVRPWSGAEIWINPEIDQGFGLSNTLGVAGFPSGEAYKVGRSSPYFKLQRLFVRQTIDLGGASEKVDPDLNQLSGRRAADRLVFTVGKIGVGDIFDTNDYAHDPRRDFMNWSLIDAGSFDYAADAWGYTYGAAAEWYVGRWAVRAGVFDLSTVPNSEKLETNFSQFQTDVALEERHQLSGRPGKIEITGFLSRGRMGRFDDAVRLAQVTGQPADIAAVRHYQSRAGLSFNLQQEVADGIGVFVHGGVADGDVEPYEFSDIDQTIAAGASFNGKHWGRPDDTFALAGVINAISRAHERFLDAGGLGILVGDGKLPHPGPEHVLETYYELALIKPVQLTLDYQFIVNPGYNRDRGPISVLTVRLHSQF
jgi:high affinity Mn2+ porin